MNTAKKRSKKCQKREKKEENQGKYRKTGKKNLKIIPAD